MEKETQTLTTDLLDKKLLLTTTILTKESDIKVFDVFDFDRLKSAEVFELYKKQIAEQNEKSVSFEISAEKLLNEKGEVDLNLLPSDSVMNEKSVKK